MMMQPKKCIATSSLCVWLVALCAAPAMAGTAVGTVTHVNGPLLLKRADGAIKAIALNSFVEQGDTLVTEKNTYAQLKFADDSEVTLKPDTQLKIEVLAYNAAVANNMDTILSISKGAVQIKTGATPRTAPENIRLVMPSLLDPVASITLDRKVGTTFVAQTAAASADSRLALYDSSYLETRYSAIRLASAESAYRSDAPAFSLPNNWDAPQLLAQMPQPKAPGLPPGLYVNVLDGMISVSNMGGARYFAAGQFGFTPDFRQPPVLLPSNPGIQFNPPPSFSAPQANPTSSGASGKSSTVDCIVR